MDGLADLGPHGVRCRHVNQVPGLPFIGQVADVDGLGQVQGLPSIA
ncbi:MAG TPA: hypothetical protein VF940_11595 [Streptosporangiaceae bacterium]